jgi:hypothetical protein
MNHELADQVFEEERFPTVRLYHDYFEIISWKEKKSSKFMYDQIASIRYDSYLGKFWFLDVTLQGWANLFYPNVIIVETKNRLTWQFKTLTLTNERLTAILREIGQRCKHTEKQ